MSRLVALLAALVALSTVSAQTPQTGIYYWCSYIELSTGNFATINTNFGTTLPRTTVIAPGTGQSAPCHFAYPGASGSYAFIASTQQAYTYTNGSSYPSNTLTSVYAIAPTSCLVRKPIQ